LFEEILLTLALLKFLVQLLRLLLLAAGLITHTCDLALDLKDLVILLLNQLLDGLKCLVTLLHAEEGLLPVLQKCLLAHHDLLDFNGGFFQGVTGSCCLFFLRDELGLVESLLFIETLDFFIH